MPDHDTVDGLAQVVPQMPAVCHLLRLMVHRRFGTMFFNDAIAAFGNIGRALRPAGRLMMVVWQAHDRNEWDVAIHQALAGPDRPTAVAGEAPDPFSLADPTTVEGIPRAAGFADIRLTDVHEPICYGPDTTAALAWVRGFAGTNELLKRLDPAADERVRDLGAHLDRADTGRSDGPDRRRSHWCWRGQRRDAVRQRTGRPAVHVTVWRSR